MWNRYKILGPAMILQHWIIGIVLLVLDHRATVDASGAMVSRVRFETLIDTPSFVALLAGIWLLVIAITAWDWYRSFSPARSIFRLSALDLDVREVFLVKVLVSWWNFILVWLFQLLSIYDSYHRFSTGAMPAWIEPPVRQGLYLAAMRSELLRFMLPARLSIAIWSIGIIGMVIVVSMGLISIPRRSHKTNAPLIWIQEVLLAVGGYSVVSISMEYADTGLWMLVPWIVLIGLILLQCRWLNRRELE